MKKYIFKRLLTALGIVLFVILLNYVIIHLAPGDPVRIMAGFDNPSQEQMDALTQKYGLDQPLYVQFWKYISALFRGDMGISYQYKVLHGKLGKRTERNLTSIKKKRLSR